MAPVELITKSSNNGSGSPRPLEKGEMAPPTTCSCLGAGRRSLWTAAHGVPAGVRPAARQHSHTLGVSPKRTHSHAAAPGASLCGAVSSSALPWVQWLAIAQKFPVGSVFTTGDILNRGDEGPHGSPPL